MHRVTFHIHWSGSDDRVGHSLGCHGDDGHGDGDHAYDDCVRVHEDGDFR